jgi:alkylation response protein AidB-like acyl-CoA dehydrogenase
LFFDDVRLPASALLGEEEGLNKGFYMMMNELPRERVGCALEALARLENAFEQTREYTQQRKAFGGPLSDKQVIKHSMAEIKTEIVSVRLMADECVRLYARRVQNFV